MIKVELFEKIYIKQDESERKPIKSKVFSKQKKYDDFISEIIKTFNIKKEDINLLAYTKDEDEFPINNQEDLDYYKDEIVEFRIIIEKDESSSSKPEHKKNKKLKEDDEEESEDKEKADKEKEDEEKENKEKNKKKDKVEVYQKDDETKNEEVEELEDIEIKIDINLYITDK